jgi:tetratricopeptide (TPR) repeat protein
MLNNASSLTPGHILHLHGDDYAMGLQHGQALKTAIARGAVPYLATYLDKLLRTSLGASGARVAQMGLRQTVGRQLRKAFPGHVLQHMRGLAAGAELPEQLFFDAFTLPETFLWLMHTSQRLRRPELAPQLAVLGCSSVFVKGAASADGHVRHARNLDYMGVGHWDQEAAVLFYTPDEGQPYVSISSAGVPLGGITAMNQSGLTLAVHQHLGCLDFELGGMPVGLIGDQVMRHAHSLSEACAILDGHRPNGGWTYLVASATENAILCYEVTAARRAWKIIDADSFVYTNMFQHQALADREAHVYPSQWRSCLGRYRFLSAQVDERSGPLDVAALRHLLGHRADPRCRLRTPTAMLTTLSSAVMEPGTGRVYVGFGPTPVSQAPFYAFDLGKQALLSDFTPLTSSQTGAEAGFDAYRQAYRAYFDDQDLDRAAQALAQACRLQPREALYAFMAGLLELARQHPEAGIAYFHQALEIGHPDPQRRAAFFLWRGRCYDACGNRDLARKDYTWALDGASDPAVAEAARAGLKRPWRWHKPALEFNYADVVTP